MTAQVEYASKEASTLQDEAQETANAAQHELENSQRRLSENEDAANGAQIGVSLTKPVHLINKLTKTQPRLFLHGSSVLPLELPYNSLWYNKHEIV
jgi:hypothetical protein